MENKTLISKVSHCTHTVKLSVFLRIHVPRGKKSFFSCLNKPLLGEEIQLDEGIAALPLSMSSFLPKEELLQCY